MKYTEEQALQLLQAIGTCQEGYEAINAIGSLGLSFDEGAALARQAGVDEVMVRWLLMQKRTEAYVRFNGRVITMGAYQVFNPLTGIHVRYDTEEEAKAALIEVAKKVLEEHMPRVVQEISNENGDTAWAATNIHESIVISTQ